MESILLSLISSYLKDYVNNFKKENISVNFLRGNGVMKDLDINVDAINESIFQSGAPGLRFVRIMINTMSIDAPFMSLKTKPIVIHIDELFIEIGEIVDIIPKPKSSKHNRSSPKYGFLDRVVDSMSFEINKVFVALRTLGRLKTTQVGPWTPPVLLLEMTGNRYVSTNQNGVEAELEECFRVRLTKRPMLFIYKKFVCKKVSAYLINPEIWFQVADEITSDNMIKTSFAKLNRKLSGGARGYVTNNIVRNLSFGFNISKRKRLDNNASLGFEIAFVFDSCHICLNQKSFSEVIHLMIGVSYALSRKDVIQHIYGPNPHEERHLQTQSNISPIKSGAPSSKSMSTKSNYDVKKEDMMNLAKLDAEITSAPQLIATAVADDDWQRSSLGSDEDPPHCRIVISWEFNDALITFSYNESTNQNDGKPILKSSRSLFRGINLHILRLVYSSIWPEHATGTEGVQQITFKSVIINEYIGVRKTCLFRTTIPLDDKGKLIPVTILPRGVKELSQFDLENQPGVSFVYRRENDFPPPPISKRIASRLEVMIGNIEVICNLDAWYFLMSFLIDSWDERLITGNWNVDGRLEDMLGSGSAETTVIISGIQFLIYPDFIRQSETEINTNTMNNDTKPSLSNAILPSQIIVDIGLLSLIWKHSLTLRIHEELKTLSKRSVSSKYVQFPIESGDIASVVTNIKPIDGFDLLSDRFEASFSEICVKVVTNTTHDSSSSIKSTPTRTVVHPFYLLYSSSIDPHPHKMPIAPPHDTFLSPYTRRYYWPITSSTINSSVLICDDIHIECSAIDITRLTHIIQLITHWFNNVSLNQSSNETVVSTEDINTITGYPVTIKMVRISKFHFLLLKDDDTIHNYKDNSIFDADIILGVQMNALDVITEWSEGPASIFSENLLVKAQFGGIAILASNRPIFILINDQLDPIVQLAGSSIGKWQLKSKTSDPAFVMRYEAKSKDLKAIVESLKEEVDTPTDGLIISQSTESLVNDLENVSDLKFRISPLTKIIVSLQNIDEALQGFLSELLSGAGVIFSNSEDWLDSSILGYIMRIYREIIAENVNSNDLNEAVIKRKVDHGHEHSFGSLPMTLIIDMDNADLVLLDVHPETQGDFVGFGSHFENISVNGKLRLPAEPKGLIIDCKSTQQFYLFTGVIGNGIPIEKRSFTNMFALSCRIHKFAADPLMLKSNVVLHDVLSSINQDNNDLANRLISENLNAITKGLSLLSSDKKGIVHYVQKSWSEISEAAIVKSKSERIKQEARIQMESLLNLTMNLLENSENIRSKELMLMNMHSPKNKNKKTLEPLPETSTGNEDDSRDDENTMETDKSQYISTEKQLLNNLRSEIQANYHRLQGFNESYNTFPTEILSAIEDINRTVQGLDACVDKMHHITIMSSNQTPTYCGWIRRSHGFSKSDRSVHGSRYWCLLIRDYLYFLNQPYGKKIEYEVYLDKAFIAVDPDDELTTQQKTALTTMLWISNPERGSNDEGVLVLDCLTLDEKCMWKEAFKPWTLVDTSIPTRRLSKGRSLLFPFGSSSASLSTTSLTTTETNTETSLNNTGMPTMNATGELEPHIGVASLRSYHDGKAASKIRSVSKGMLKAITLSRKGVTNTINNVAQATVSVIKTKDKSQLSHSNLQVAIQMNQRHVKESASSVGNDDKQLESMSSGSLTDETIGAINIDDSSNEHQATYRIHREESINESPLIMDVLDELDDLRSPLYQYAIAMDHMKSVYLKKYKETRRLVENMRNSLFAMFLGLSILHAIEDENDKAVRDEVKECKLQINKLLKELHDEKTKNHVLMENWTKSRQLQRESESVLQAITMQHISTVLNMSKQYDDLMDQYQMIRMTPHDAAYFALSSTRYARESEPISPQDLIRQLAKALQETETLTKQAVEREQMMKQEVMSIQMETDSTRQENMRLNQCVDDLNNKLIQNEMNYQLELEKEEHKRRILERERDLYKTRYESLLCVLQQLNVQHSLLDDHESP